MSALRLLLPTALLAMAFTPAFAQDVPNPPPEAAPPPPAAERSVRSRARDADGAVRTPGSAERVALPAARQRERRDEAAPAPATAPAFEEQAQRRPSGGNRGSGRVGGGGRNRGDGGAVRRGGVRNPEIDNRGGEVAQAVPRGRAPRPPQVNWGRSTARRYYAGPSGLGYYYYDPWSWYYGGWPAFGAYAGGWGGYYGNNWGGYYGNNWGGYYGGGPYGGGGNYGNYGGPYGWSIGGVRIKVDERDAEVYVDGYYAGIVDDFDGIWQQLRLDDGPYRLEIRKPGYEPLVFDVRVQPGRTITYRGEMQQVP